MIKLNNITKQYIDTKINIKNIYFKKTKILPNTRTIRKLKTNNAKLNRRINKANIWKYTNQFRKSNYRDNKTNTRNYRIHTTDFKLFGDFTVKDSIEILLNLSNK